MDQICHFLTGESDTVPEFKFNWITVESNHDNIIINCTHQPQQQIQLTLTPLQSSPPPGGNPSTSSSTVTANFPYWSPTPSTSCTRPGLMAATSKDTAPGATVSIVLRLAKPVNYWELLLGKKLKLALEQFLKQCRSARNLVCKSVAKVKKLMEVFLPFCEIHPHLLRPHQNELRANHSKSGPTTYQHEEFQLCKTEVIFKHIGCYVATLIDIHVCIPFKFTQVFYR